MPSSTLLSLESPLALPFPRSLLIAKKKKKMRKTSDEMLADDKVDDQTGSNGKVVANLERSTFPQPRTCPIPSSSILSRLKTFLPEMEAANEQLKKKLQAGEDVGLDLQPDLGSDDDTEKENSSKEDEKRMIEMTLGFFQRQSDSESEDDDDDDDNETLQSNTKSKHKIVEMN